MVQEKQTMYSPVYEHDACGIGAVVNMKGIASHKTVDDALKIVEKLEHRAGKDASGETGDGVGILLQISHEFFQEAAERCSIPVKGRRQYGVGMFFFPQDETARGRAMKTFEAVAQGESLQFLGWRQVPVKEEVLGSRARECMPSIYQCFIERPDNIETDLDFDRRLYVLRRLFEKGSSDTYTVSLSCRTIIYKGMFLVGQLREFYSDLQDEKYASAIAMVHSRFSTNTNPSWERAHPYRVILHNGEINTIRGNVDRMLTREETMKSSVLGSDIEKVLPCVVTSGSDSAMLDNTLEFLMMSGMPLPLAMMITIPEPFRVDNQMSRAKKDFYHYYSTMMEPWDGPAAVLYTDGDVVGASLDRNGLRPARYYLTDDTLILSSEVGVLPIPEETIVQKSRLAPGKMLLVDTVRGEVISDEECKDYYATRYPFGEWLDQSLTRLSDLPIPNKKVEKHSQKVRDRLYKAFGYSYESIKERIIPMAKSGSEPITAMGVDIPLAVLSDKHQPLFNYFKQMFAQVTNPPIDAIREEIVTDTSVYIGSDGNLLVDNARNCRAVEIRNPILSNVDLMKIRSMKKPGLKVSTVSMLYPIGTSLKEALDHMFEAFEKAYQDGFNVIILSDRGVDESHLAIPSLLAVSAMEQYLIRTKRRTAVSVILESGEPREVHHFAALLGYGARAVNSYLVQECIEESIDKGLLDKDSYTAVRDYNEAVLHGIVKIASKMGISTISSYQSAQIFEAIGIDKDVIEIYFTNTISRVGGIGLREIDEGVKYRHEQAFLNGDDHHELTIDSGATHKLRSGEEDEEHMYNPLTITALREAVQTGNYKRFKEYTALLNDELKPHTLRGILDFVPLREPISIDEVESAEEIVKRFKTGAMSYGSLSKEAHECMAIAMNRIRGKSNSGEGGEDPERLGTERSSAIKQVASGRFGVTGEYLLSAKEIQIKMAQGAKPGEGGHLPGEKVYPWIAKTRHSTPGVALISPPPHHDIYSIEDLAQLIYDLKNANTRARISVKLVSEAGVGTIASGVAKAGAQVILISGYDGGTGAAPPSSIHNAGLPWELGLAETHQTLIQNGLRSKVVIETDGKLMSGRDVAVAAMLGAEEFGFATAPLVAMGCIMMRVCNLDTCPVGIATQNPELRSRFAGKPEYVINFMMYIAEELREIMASLGVRTVDELIGRTDLLRVRNDEKLPLGAKTLDFAKILNAGSGSGKERFREQDVYDFQLESTVDVSVLLPAFEKAIQAGEKHEVSIDVSSTNRTVGTILGSRICEVHKNSLSEDTFIVNCRGGGGQSFGAFIPKGLTLRLTGDSNDYFGKGLSGGKLVLKLPPTSKLKAEENIILGNVALYGATSGEAYINGVAGERFCVRNSGATAVVEGVGDHGCEYMTGGVVCVLGRTGKNFAAGMSGGIAYVLDEKHDLYTRLNKELVVFHELEGERDIQIVYALIQKHVAETSSELGQKILLNFSYYSPLFKKVVPVSYSEMLQATEAFEKQGFSHEEAQNKAFYVLHGSKNGKQTRKENHEVSPGERIKSFCEFHLPLNEADRRVQGARCMNCGIPFCQSGVSFDGVTTGCPLNNLIPEWNEQIHNGNPKYALSRLLKTNNFPEFTGRVCPQLCEAACTCGLHGEPVAIRDNELWLIENAFETGCMMPRVPKVRSGKRVAVVGSGPAGLAVADSLNQRGHSVTVYERDDRPGGLLMYGIPNMKLDKGVVERRISLMAAEGVTFVTNADVGRNVSASELMSQYDAVILACGAKKARDLPVHNRTIEGVYFAVDFLAATTRSLLNSKLEDGNYIDAKGKHVVIVGGGDTGNDCVGTSIRHGCESVTQLEMMPQPPATRAENNLWPRFPRTLKTDYGQQEAIEVFGSDPRMFSTTVSEIITDETGRITAVKTVKLAQQQDEATGRMVMAEVPNSEEILKADLLIIAAGFVGCEGYVPEAFGTALTPRGTVQTVRSGYQTNISRVFSCGDMKMGQSLVVHAIKEGRACAKQVDAFLVD